MAFACQDQISAQEGNLQTILETLYSAGHKGPWQTSRGVLRVVKRSLGRGMKGTKFALVGPKSPVEIPTVEV
jgi:hypothetical protein